MAMKVGSEIEPIFTVWRFAQVHAHLSDLHTLLRQQGPAAAAAGAAALLAERGANYSQCTSCNLSFLTVRKVGTIIACTLVSFWNKLFCGL